MNELLIKAKLLLMPLWGRLLTVWALLLAKWNALLEKLSTVEIPVLKKKLSPRSIGMSIIVLVALIAIICLKSCGKEIKQQPTPVTTGALNQRLRPLGHVVSWSPAQPPATPARRNN